MRAITISAINRNSINQSAIMRASLSGDLSGLLFNAKLKSARSINQRYGLGQELSFRLFHRFVIYSSYGAREKQFQKSEWTCWVSEGIALRKARISAWTRHMLRRTFAALWRRAPKWARRLGVLLTESRFTVTVGAVVIDSRNRVLLLHHRFRPGGGWGIPGGFMCPREQPEEAVRRELREEIGLEIEVASVAFIRTLQKYRQVEIIFRCAPKGTPIPQGFEINRAEWFELNSLPDSLSEDQRGLIRRALGS